MQNSATWNKGTRFVKWIYMAAVFVLAVTGFGQMPIYKRYYIADLPGLGWLADFYITHYLHYIAAAIFFALITYSIILYFLQRSERRMSGTGMVRVVMRGAKLDWVARGSAMVSAIRSRI